VKETGIIIDMEVLLQNESAALNIIFYQETKHFYIDDIRVHTEEICF
jgi:hypothetical protein